MTSALDDVHPPIIIPRSLQLLDALHAAYGVHPVVVAIHKSNIHVLRQGVYAVDEGQAGVCAWREDVRDAVFAGALGERDVHDVVVHVAGLFWCEVGEAAGGVLEGAG